MQWIMGSTGSLNVAASSDACLLRSPSWLHCFWHSSKAIHGETLILNGKSGVGIIVDYSRDYTVVNGV